MTAVPPRGDYKNGGHMFKFQPLKGNDGRAAFVGSRGRAGPGEFQPLKGNDGRAAKGEKGYILQLM